MSEIRNIRNQKLFLYAKKGEIIVGLYLLSYSPNNYYNNPYPFFSSFFPQKIGKK